ncbi:MAG: hypothetical protein MZV63_45910 [Marinilabiliales bacterium]|nr:hypothetical protein [Marinilabiliales bacterium]
MSKPGNLRYISGNVLTGTRIEPDGYLGYYDSQVTVIPEGNYFEFFGWTDAGTEKVQFLKDISFKFHAQERLQAGYQFSWRRTSFCDDRSV